MVKMVVSGNLMFIRRKLAAEPGFEPGQMDSKSIVLPLHNSASGFKVITDILIRSKYFKKL